VEKTDTRYNQEPWETWDEGSKGDLRYVIIAEGKLIVQTVGGNDEANARRICAAINACEHIPTEMLENIVVTEFIDACIAIERWLRKNVKAVNRPAWLDQKLLQLITIVNKKTCRNCKLSYFAVDGTGCLKGHKKTDKQLQGNTIAENCKDFEPREETKKK